MRLKDYDEEHGKSKGMIMTRIMKMIRRKMRLEETLYMDSTSARTREREIKRGVSERGKYTKKKGRGETEERKKEM